ncbi:MAG TPA: hypothetical protein PL167_08680 [Cyclobacteriaceae bacterium]|nr:hypothetical protein [Cyclobacteriaceae bacterium]
MPSLIPGYEYDIFISYRHNDNRSGWVTEFVNALQEELAATIKEPLSIYFDKNPHDGLLETHDVDESVKKKVKALIFIPIISQTYCDPGSFAWQNEFLPFKTMAETDQFGLKVRLSNGNVANRMLPIRIHDIDASDQHLLENVLQTKLRPIDFIYHSSGVNRPLTPKDERDGNINRLYYRDQINKVGNAIKEIIKAIKFPPIEPPAPVALPGEQGQPKSKNSKRILVVTSVLIISLFASWYFFVRSAVDQTAIVDPSVAVVPFENLSRDPSQEYISDGITDAIRSHLNKIEGLRLISSTTMATYKDTKKTTPEIATDLAVKFVLEGSVQKVGNKIRINTQLVNAATDNPVWSEYYDRDMADLLLIESEVAQKIVENLKVKIHPDAKISIAKLPTKNPEAYELYLKASQLRTANGNLDSLRLLAEKAIQLDPNFAGAYERLGWYWVSMGLRGGAPRHLAITNAELNFNKALSLNPEDVDTQINLGLYNLWYKWDFYGSERALTRAIQLAPSNSSAYYTDLKVSMGRYQEAVEWARHFLSIEPNSTTARMNMGFTLFFNGEHEQALRWLDSARLISKPDSPYFTDLARGYLYLGRFEDALKAAETGLQVHLLPVRMNAIKSIALLHMNKEKESRQLLKELTELCETTAIGSPAFYSAMVYAAMGEIDVAFKYLEKSFEAHEVEFYWLKVEPPFAPLRRDPRWKQLMDKVPFP